jgi:hypothetical protein
MKIVLLLLSAVLGAKAFTGLPLRHTTASTSSRLATTRLLDKARDDEIAKLEAKIRKMQEEDTGNEEGEEMQGQVESREKLVSMRLLENSSRAQKDMMLSEGDLVKAGLMEQGSGGGNIIPAALAAVGVGVLLLLFSQVPVGQEDLSRYSASASVTTIDLGDINPDRKSSSP